MAGLGQFFGQAISKGVEEVGNSMIKNGEELRKDRRAKVVADAKVLESDKQRTSTEKLAGDRNLIQENENNRRATHDATILSNAAARDEDTATHRALIITNQAVEKATSAAHRDKIISFQQTNTIADQEFRTLTEQGRQKAQGATAAWRKQETTARAKSDAATAKHRLLVLEGMQSDKADTADYRKKLLKAKDDESKATSEYRKLVIEESGKDRTAKTETGLLNAAVDLAAPNSTGFVNPNATADVKKNLAALKGEAPPPVVYNTKNDVKAAMVAGTISREEAVRILQEKFGGQ